jgi:hypothetical protein
MLAPRFGRWHEARSGRRFVRGREQLLVTAGTQIGAPPCPAEPPAPPIPPVMLAAGPASRSALGR